MLNREPQPLISIVMPVYNGAVTLDRALRFVVAQTFRDWEVVAVDDASTDASANILERWAAKDGRVRLIRLDENRGVSAARNSAIQNAPGPLVTYLDQDDEYYPDYLANVARLYDKADVLVFGYDFVYDDGPAGGRLPSWEPGAVRQFLFAEAIVTPLGVAHRRELWQKVGGFNEAWCEEDSDLWRRMARAGAKFTCVAVDQVLATETVPPGSGGTQAAGPVNWYLTDGQGTVRDVVQLLSGVATVVDHVVYGSFGNATQGDNFLGDFTDDPPPEFGFNGMRLDPATGLYTADFRFYDPLTGNWLSQDPLGFAAGQTNLSEYCGNSPTNATDPSGLATWIMNNAQASYAAQWAQTASPGGAVLPFVSQQFVDDMRANHDAGFNPPNAWDQNSPYQAGQTILSQDLDSIMNVLKVMAAKGPISILEISGHAAEGGGATRISHHHHGELQRWPTVRSHHSRCDHCRLRCPANGQYHGHGGHRRREPDRGQPFRGGGRPRRIPHLHV